MPSLGGPELVVLLLVMLGLVVALPYGVNSLVRRAVADGQADTRRAQESRPHFEG